MRNICEEFLKDQIEMWLDNYQEDLDNSCDEELNDTRENLQKRLDDITESDISDIISNLMNNDYLWETVDNTVREEIDYKIKEKSENND